MRDCWSRAPRRWTRCSSGAEAIPESCDRIAEHENAADDVTRDVLVAVRRSFITPFDRSAITALAGAMDDAIDEMWQTAKAITLYEVESFEPQMREMSALALGGGAAGARGGAADAQHRPQRRPAARDHRGDRPSRGPGRRPLQRRPQGSVPGARRRSGAMDFFVGREVYRHLERVLDGFEDVADEIQGIVIDHA